jgi:hypothetical protein
MIALLCPTSCSLALPTLEWSASGNSSLKGWLFYLLSWCPQINSTQYSHWHQSHAIVELGNSASDKAYQLEWTGMIDCQNARFNRRRVFTLHVEQERLNSAMIWPEKSTAESHVIYLKKIGLNRKRLGDQSLDYNWMHSFSLNNRYQQWLHSIYTWVACFMLYLDFLSVNVHVWV